MMLTSTKEDFFLDKTPHLVSRNKTHFIKVEGDYYSYKKSSTEGTIYLTFSCGPNGTSSTITCGY